MIRVDGSLGEGGSHTLRTALGLAAATGQETEVVNIRKSRRAPGLRFEQIAAARALAQVSGGRLEGDSSGSTTLRFRPGRAAPGAYEFAVEEPAGKTGSATTLASALLPVLAVAGGGSEVVVHGATHAAAAQTATYFQTVVVPTLRKLGFRGEAATERWGWAPEGRGIVRLRVEAAPLRGRDLAERGQMLQLGGIAVASMMEPGYAERLKNRAVRRLAEVGRGAQIQTQAVPSESKGAMLFLLAVFERAIAGFTAAPSADEVAEEVADDAIDKLFAYQTSYAAIDRLLGDQLLVFAALAEGTTTFTTSEVTPELLTSAALVRQFLPAKVKISGGSDGPAEVAVSGAGLVK